MRSAASSPPMIAVALAAEDAPKVSEACFANAVAADVLVNGRKIAGAAQRRTRAGLLHQGSIQYEALPITFAEAFASALCPEWRETSFTPELLARAEQIDRREVRNRGLAAPALRASVFTELLDVAHTRELRIEDRACYETGRDSPPRAVEVSSTKHACCFDSWEPSFYPAPVEVFTSSPALTASASESLAQIARSVQNHLDEVEARIAQQAAVFDPAVEGYVSYAIGGRGKRLRPLVALLSGGATGRIKSEHVDLAVILELIHIATLVHDDIMDEAERRRGQPTVNARWGNALSVLLGDCLFAQALNLSTNFDNAEISRAIAQAAREVCSGEIIQTQRRFDLHLAIEDYRKIVEMKTGSLFAVAAELGAAHQ